MVRPRGRGPEQDGKAGGTTSIAPGGSPSAESPVRSMKVALICLSMKLIVASGLLWCGVSVNSLSLSWPLHAACYGLRECVRSAEPMERCSSEILLQRSLVRCVGNTLATMLCNRLEAGVDPVVIGRQGLHPHDSSLQRLLPLRPQRLHANQLHLCWRPVNHAHQAAVHTRPAQGNPHISRQSPL